MTVDLSMYDWLLQMDRGRRIRTLRVAKGLSQEDLGEALDRTRATVGSWETKDAQPDDLDTLHKLAQVLDVPVEVFTAPNPEGEE